MSKQQAQTGHFLSFSKYMNYMYSIQTLYTDHPLRWIPMSQHKGLSLLLWSKSSILWKQTKSLLSYFLTCFLLERGLEDSLSGNTCTRAARYDRENGRLDRAKTSTTSARILGWVSGPSLSHTTCTVRSEPADSAASLGFGCLWPS